MNLMQNIFKLNSMKHLLIVALCIFLLSCKTETKNNSNSQTQGNEELPNIILLIGDDQGYPYFGFMGADYVHTPNMDAMAASGTLFTPRLCV
jgi:arylsulfatase A